MQYILQDMLESDREKVKRDLERDQDKRLTMRYLGFLDTDNVWAYDRGLDGYLIEAPVTREDVMIRRYYFHYETKWYAIHIRSYENLVNFDDPEPSEIEERTLFRKNLAEALFSFGHLGYGSGEGGDPVVAEFAGQPK